MSMNDYSEYEDSGEFSLLSFIKIVLRNKSTLIENEDNRVLLYRGHSNQGYGLIPSVFRDNYIKREHDLVKELHRYCPEEFNTLPSTLDKLIKMQHYGLPTRLLDVTLNPLVALFFACQENDGDSTDGEVIAIPSYVKTTEDFKVSLYAELATIDDSNLKRVISAKFKQDDKNIRELQDELKNEFEERSIPIIVAQNNNRIKRQQGAFLLFGLDPNSEMFLSKKTIFDEKPLLQGKAEEGIESFIKIPKEEKAKILKELDAIGINHSFLFPELEHQATYLKNKFAE